MRKLLFLIVLIPYLLSLRAEETKIDSLLNLLDTTQVSMDRVVLAKQIVRHFYNSLQYDSTVIYAKTYLAEFSPSIYDNPAIRTILRCKFLSERHIGQYPEMLETIKVFEATDKQTPLSIQQHQFLWHMRYTAQLKMDNLKWEDSPHSTKGFQTRAFELSDSIIIQNQRNTFIHQEAELQFALERKNLAVQQNLQAQQIREQRLGLLAACLGLLFIGSIAFSLFRNYQREQKQKNELLQIEQLRRTNERLSRFVNSISHDIMGGLNTIITSSNLVLESDLQTSKAKHYYNSSRESVAWLRDYCQKLLVWSDKEEEETALEETSLASIVENILYNRREELDLLGFEVKVEALPQVRMPYAPLLQIMQNLIDNAIKYTKSKANPILKIAAIKERVGWTILVKDNGIGIPKENRAELFKGTTDTTQVHGRGLAHVKAILTEYEETIWVERNEWNGTTFSFTLR